MSIQQQQQQRAQNTTKSIGNYILGRTIGEGTFGKVKLGRHILSGANVAVKVLQKDRIVEVADVERVAREVHILKLIRHPHIVQLFEIIETRGQLYLIMEYASGGELFDHIVAKGRVPEVEACRFFHQIIAGVEKIHEMRVVHRDLKPENLLLDEHSCIKIVDFGLSNLFREGQRLSTACGSPCYAPPEMVAGQQYVPQMCDLWSCGVILFALVCGYLPFEDQNTAALYKKILAADYTVPNFISDVVKDLIGGLLTVDPQKRYTVATVRAHPWYRQVPEASVAAKEGPTNVDEEVLHELEAYGFPRDYAVRCLELNKHNHITTTYYLLLERKRRVLEQLEIPGGGPGDRAAGGALPVGYGELAAAAVKATSSTATPGGGLPRALFGEVDLDGARGPDAIPIAPGAFTADLSPTSALTPRSAQANSPGPGAVREASGTPRCDNGRNVQAAQVRRISAGVRPNTSPVVREPYSARGKVVPDAFGTGLATTPRTASPWHVQQSATPNPYSARGVRGSDAYNLAQGAAVGGASTPGVPWQRPQSTTPNTYSARVKSTGGSETPVPGGTWRTGATTPLSARGSGPKVVTGGSITPDIGSTSQYRQTSTTPQGQRNSATPRSQFTPRAGGGPRASTPQSTAYRSPVLPQPAGAADRGPDRGPTLPSGVPGVGGRNSVMSSRRRPPASTNGTISPSPVPIRAGGTPTPRTRGVVHSR